MKVSRLYELSIGLAVIPVVRSREESLYIEAAAQAGPELSKGLDVAVGPVYLPLAMAEVHVRHNESAILVEEFLDFAELLGLELSDVLKNTLGQDDIELPVAKPDGDLKKVRLDQIRRWVVYGYINPVVMHVIVEEAHQSRLPAPNVMKITLLFAGDLVDDTRRLLEPEVRANEFQVLFTPEISLVI